jgi:hypothetical protein
MLEQSELTIRKKALLQMELRWEQLRRKHCLKTCWPQIDLLRRPFWTVDAAREDVGSWELIPKLENCWLTGEGVALSTKKISDLEVFGAFPSQRKVAKVNSRSCRIST